MKKGYSGATIDEVNGVIVKTSNSSLESQYKQCIMLYPVTPEVHGCHLRGNQYVMEKLQEPPNGAVASLYLEQMLEVLRDTVWCRHLPTTQNESWRLALVDFANQWFDIEPAMSTIQFFKARCLIHGDPTLSNLMFRHGIGFDQLCIVDPIEPVGKIPSVHYVDIGKLLQSAIGWETCTMDWGYDYKKCVSRIFSQCGTSFTSTNTIRQSWFWCMIHCLRILPYVANDSKEYAWAYSRANAINKFLIGKEEISCAMPSILMEL